jgi:hypothetical protein
MIEVSKKILAFERKRCRKVLGTGQRQKFHCPVTCDRIQPKESLWKKVIRGNMRLLGLMCSIKDDRNMKMVM